MAYSTFPSSKTPQTTLHMPRRLTRVLIFTALLLLLVLRLSHGWRPHSDVDWSRFSYIQYVTDSDYLCNSVMLFESLHRLGSKADRVMLYPWYMANQDEGSSDHQLLIKARDEYNVRLVPVAVQHRNTAERTWADSFTKLLAFNQTEYSRVLYLDSDSTVLQPMDELFLLPSSTVAMPRAYWLNSTTLSSQLVLIEPDTAEFERLARRAAEADSNEFDMEVLNDMYGDNALILPHRPYNMISSEFRQTSHDLYFGSDKWDPLVAYTEAKYVHFSDWPVPKPWIAMSEEKRLLHEPDCPERPEPCLERQFWNNLYTDFQTRRRRVCPHHPIRQSK